MNPTSIGVVASTPTVYLSWLLADLGELGIPAKWVFLGSATERRLFALRSLSRVRKRHGWLEVLSRIADRRSSERSCKREAPDFTSLQSIWGFEVVPYDNVSGGRFLLDVLQRAPSLLLLAGCGIVDSSLLTIPKLGVLNCHPALLPGARGVDVIEWSLIRDLPLGVTTHFVSANVDAGPIILRRDVMPRPGDSLAEFRMRMLRMQARCLADAAGSVISGDYTVQENDLTKSTLFHASRRADRRLAESKFAMLTKSCLASPGLLGQRRDDSSAHGSL